MQAYQAAIDLFPANAVPILFHPSSITIYRLCSLNHSRVQLEYHKSLHSYLTENLQHKNPFLAKILCLEQVYITWNTQSMQYYASRTQSSLHAVQSECVEGEEKCKNG